jgi:predicted DNA-binding ArsR family transcriptional regulator
MFITTEEELKLVTKEDFNYVKSLVKDDEEVLKEIEENINKNKSYLKAVLDYYGSEDRIPTND